VPWDEIAWIRSLHLDYTHQSLVIETCGGDLAAVQLKCFSKVCSEGVLCGVA